MKNDHWKSPREEQAAAGRDRLIAETIAFLWKKKAERPRRVLPVLSA